jgi:hypothetical protein
MRYLTTSSLAIAGLATVRCAAQQVSTGNRTEYFGHLEHLFDSPNATSFATMKGPDVSKAYPGHGSADWEAFIRLTGNVLPLRNSSSREDRITVADTGVTISNDSSLRGPNDTFKAHDSWAMCIGFELLIASNDEYPLDKEVDPSCKGLVEDKCLEWLEELASEGDFCSKPMHDSELWENTPCQGNEKVLAESIGPWRSKKLDGLPLHDMSWMTVFEKGDESNSTKASLEAYDSMVQSVWMVWVGFGHSDDLRRGESRMREGDVKVPSMFRCIRADNFAEGSRDTEDIQKSIEEDAGAGLRISMALAGVVGCVAMIMNMI